MCKHHAIFHKELVHLRILVSQHLRADLPWLLRDMANENYELAVVNIPILQIIS